MPLASGSRLGPYEIVAPLGAGGMGEVYRGPTASTNSQPQPSLYIFTPKHYSMLRVGGTTARPGLPPDVSKATAAELNAIWGSPFAANSGTYDVSGSTLTTRPVVAKNPSVMASGAFTEYSLKLDGNNFMVDRHSNEYGPGGQPNHAQTRSCRIGARPVTWLGGAAAGVASARAVLSHANVAVEYPERLNIALDSDHARAPRPL